MLEITIQEAISHLERYTKEFYNTHNRRAHQMAIDALREKELQPLTISDLRNMQGERVYCLDLNTEVRISAPKVGFIMASYSIQGEWGACKAADLTLYRQRPAQPEMIANADKDISGLVEDD